MKRIKNIISSKHFWIYCALMTLSALIIALPVVFNLNVGYGFGCICGALCVIVSDIAEQEVKKFNEKEIKHDTL